MLSSQQGLRIIATNNFINKLIYSLFSLLVTVASTPESILNKTDSIALRDLSTEPTSSSTNVQTEAQSKNGQISSKLTAQLTTNRIAKVSNDTFVPFSLVFSEDSGLTIVRRLSGKNKQQSEVADNQLEQYIYSDSETSVPSGFCSFIENRLKMQPTSLNDNLDSIDLTTESLPAVDTPDACDKAALR